MPPSSVKLLTRTAVPDVLGATWSPAPLYPPLDWFSDEAADAAPPKLTPFPDGRVAGVVAPAGVCTLNEVIPGECWTAPRPADGRGSTLLCGLFTGESEEDYRKAHVGTTMTAEGVEIVTANLSGAGGHANPHASVLGAQVHYNDASDDTRFQVARGRYVWSDQAGGLVFVGALWPEVNERNLAEVRAAACSVDYRWIRGQSIDDYRLVGTCLVNIGALPSRFAALLDHGALPITPEVVNRLYAEAENLTRAAALADALDFSQEQYAMPQTAIRVTDPVVTEVPPPGEPCHDCEQQEQARQAAYVRVDDPAPSFGAEVTWSGGVGMYCDRVAMADGSPGFIVFPIVDGSVDESQPTTLAASEATVTGARYDYVYADELIDDLVITASTALGPRLAAGRTTRTAAVGDEAAPTESADVETRLTAVEEGIGRVEAMVGELHAALVEEKLAEVDS